MKDRERGVQSGDSLTVTVRGAAARDDRAVRSLLARAIRVVRLMLGAPDYERYLDHARRRGCGHVPLSRSEFEREALNDRYTRPGSRCC